MVSPGRRRGVGSNCQGFRAYNANSMWKHPQNLTQSTSCNEWGDIWNNPDVIKWVLEPSKVNAIINYCIKHWGITKNSWIIFHINHLSNLFYLGLPWAQREIKTPQKLVSDQCKLFFKHYHGECVCAVLTKIMSQLVNSPAEACFEPRSYADSRVNGKDWKAEASFWVTLWECDEPAKLLWLCEHNGYRNTHTARHVYSILWQCLSDTSIWACAKCTKLGTYVLNISKERGRTCHSQQKAGVKLFHSWWGHMVLYIQLQW